MTANQLRSSITLVLLCGLVVTCSARGEVPAELPRRQEARGPLQVFILAGQSNMEGKAKLRVAEYQANQPATRALYAPMWREGRWMERPDVWIKFLDRKGPLTAGCGSPGCFGPELGFGWIVGDHYAPRGQQVLLIKAAWGGRSLYRDFRPPSAGLPPDAVLEKMLAELRKGEPNATRAQVEQAFGASYRAMLDEIRQTLANLKALFPEYQSQGYALAGLVWFQGWNDMIDADYTAAYAANMTHFIRDVRNDLNVPRLPIVIGQMGVDGDHPSPQIRTFKDAQAAVLDVPEFRGSVALVKTDAFWDKDADAVFKSGWREHQDAWDHLGSDYPYHYLGSPRTMLAIGRAFGQSMLDLQQAKAPEANSPGR